MCHNLIVTDIVSAYAVPTSTQHLILSGISLNIHEIVWHYRYEKENSLFHRLSSYIRGLGEHEHTGYENM
jgi:hypothetical protein